MGDEQKKKSRRGFASMDPKRQRAIASQGGLSVKKENRSFSQDPQLAAKAGHKGGVNVPAEQRTFYKDPEHAAACGRKGGQTRRNSKNGAIRASLTGSSDGGAH